MGRDRSGGITTRYRPDGLGSNPGVGARFSAPVQTGPGVCFGEGYQVEIWQCS